MNQLQVFSNERLGKIRTMNIDGQPYFVGKDIAEALGYEKPRNAIATHVHEDDKTTALIQGAGSNYKSKAVLINESGMYALIFGSKLEQAQEFKHWVTSEACIYQSDERRINYVRRFNFSCDDVIRRTYGATCGGGMQLRRAYYLGAQGEVQEAGLRAEAQGLDGKRKPQKTVGKLHKGE